MANITPSYETMPTLQRDWDPLRTMREMMRWDPFQAISPATYRDRAGYSPAFDVTETNNAYVFTADVPGLKEADIDITVTGNRITVSGKREEEKREEGRNWYACERTYGQFSRSFTLPEGCKLDDVQANLENGVLTMNVPKKNEVQSRRVTLGKPGKNKVH